MPKYKHILRPIEEIDKSILAYIIQMNEEGHRTDHCCSGVAEDHTHLPYFDGGIERPHVSFFIGNKTGNMTDSDIDEYSICIDNAGKRAGFIGEEDSWGLPRYNLHLKLRERNGQQIRYTKADVEMHFNSLVNELKVCIEKIPYEVRKRDFPFI